MDCYGLLMIVEAGQQYQWHWRARGHDISCFFSQRKWILKALSTSNFPNSLCLFSLHQMNSQTPILPRPRKIFSDQGEYSNLFMPSKIGLGIYSDIISLIRTHAAQTIAMALLLTGVICKSWVNCLKQRNPFTDSRVEWHVVTSVWTCKSSRICHCGLLQQAGL